MRGETPFDNTGDVNDDPAAFLKLPASDEGKLLTEQADQFSGSLVPFWMFAEVAVRQRKTSAWIADRTKIEGKIRRRAAAGLATLAANLVLLFGYAAHRLEAGGAAEERAIQQERAAVERRDTLEREIQDLRIDVRELRAAMRRMSGVDGLGPESSESPLDPDRISILSGALEIFASGLPKPPRRPRLCGQTCNSSIECSGGVTRACPFCNFGTCRSTRPEEPIPKDAGVDAPGGTQP